MIEKPPQWTRQERKSILLLLSQCLLDTDLTLSVIQFFRPILEELLSLQCRHVLSLPFDPSFISEISQPLNCIPETLVYATQVFSLLSKLAQFSSPIYQISLDFFSNLDILQFFQNFFLILLLPGEQLKDRSISIQDYQKVADWVTESLRALWRFSKKGFTINQIVLVRIFNIYKALNFVPTQNHLNVSETSNIKHSERHNLDQNPSLHLPTQTTEPDILHWISIHQLPILSNIYYLISHCLMYSLHIKGQELECLDANIDTGLKNSAYLNAINEEDATSKNLLTLFASWYNSSPQCNNTITLSLDYPAWCYVTSDDMQSGMVDVAGLLLPPSTSLVFPVDPLKVTPTLNNINLDYSTSNLCDSLSTKPDAYSPSSYQSLPFFVTPTVHRHLHALALAIAKAKPILLIGPTGSGKSSLIQHAATLLGKKLTTVHVGEALDAKTLLGGYISTDVPGQFKWIPGIVTRAVTDGDWLVIEDINLASPEVLGILQPLADSRQLFISSRGENIIAASGFTFFATYMLYSTDMRPNFYSSMPIGDHGASIFSSFTRTVIDLLSGSELVLMINNAYGFGVTLSELMVDIYQALIALHSQMSKSICRIIERPITIRELLRWARRFKFIISERSRAPHEHDASAQHLEIGLPSYNITSLDQSNQNISPTLSANSMEIDYPTSPKDSTASVVAQLVEDTSCQHISQDIASSPIISLSLNNVLKEKQFISYSYKEILLIEALDIFCAPCLNHKLVESRLSLFSKYLDITLKRILILYKQQRPSITCTLSELPTTQNSLSHTITNGSLVNLHIGRVSLTSYCSIKPVITQHYQPIQRHIPSEIATSSGTSNTSLTSIQSKKNSLPSGSNRLFVLTTTNLQILERIAQAVKHNEPILMVGETGCGKTSMIQYLAGQLQRHLVVINLSQSSDIVDLVGGFKPVDLAWLARSLFRTFQILFVRTVSKSKNQEFLSRLYKAQSQKNWKLLVSFFEKTCKLASNKLNKQLRELKVELSHLQDLHIATCPGNKQTQLGFDSTDIYVTASTIQALAPGIVSNQSQHNILDASHARESAPFLDATSSPISSPMVNESSSHFDKYENDTIYVTSKRRKTNESTMINHTPSDSSYSQLSVEHKKYDNELKPVSPTLVSDTIRSSDRINHHSDADYHSVSTARENKIRKVQDIIQEWINFELSVKRFSIQVNGAKAFHYVEGALVRALQSGHWILLDEINLSTPETLECLCSILEGKSLILSERGDKTPIVRHPDFLLFAAMNPPNDVGKAQLVPSLRARFSEFYLDEIENPNDLAMIVNGYLSPIHAMPPVMPIVEFYLQSRAYAQSKLVDGSNERPRYNLRSLARALEFTVQTSRIFAFDRALLEGFQMVFLTQLNGESYPIMWNLIQTAIRHRIFPSLSDKELSRPPRMVKGQQSKFVDFEAFSLECGPLEPFCDPDFVLTPNIRRHLIHMARALTTRKYPILLQGPTSAGKTSMVEYLCKLTGHRFLRVNNSEQTDLPEYFGQYIHDAQGNIVYHDGVLVDALRNGHWIVLDELNLAPSEVLEALNRLLDDNRQLYIPELLETIEPHPHFCLFATQNPPGLYGGRKVLSRAFRSRFLEMHISEIPDEELETILCQRSRLPISYCKKLIEVMKELQRRRQVSSVFAGKHALITLRDLFKWASRSPSTYEELGMHGYFLLADRLREDSDRQMVKDIIEKTLRIHINPDNIYDSYSEFFLKRLNQYPDLPKSSLNEIFPFSTTEKAESAIQNCYAPFVTLKNSQTPDQSHRIVLTQSTKRVLALLSSSLKHKEPVLLVGPPGTGKTALVELYAHFMSSKLEIVNCHQNTEISDLLGGLRPIRNKENLSKQFIFSIKHIFPILSKIEFLYSDLKTKYPQLDHIFDTVLNWPVQEDQLKNFISNANDSDNAILSTDEPWRVLMQSNMVLIDSIIQILRTLADRIAQTPKLHLHDTFSKADYGQHIPLQQGQNQTTITVIEPSSPSDHDFTIRFYWSKLSQLVSSSLTYYTEFNNMFSWYEGPLSRCMKQGHTLLIDEISLADDAVLERLNSVLEPNRLLVLSEKGGDEIEELIAHSDFRILSTMNPGGDFGKKELSPALRNRFTEIYVPAISLRQDLFNIILQNIRLGRVQCQQYYDYVPHSIDVTLTNLMLDFVEYLVDCSSKQWDFTLRDVLAWAQFVSKMFCRIGIVESYLHGADMLILDGLGITIPDQAHKLRLDACTFLQKQVSSHFLSQSIIYPSLYCNIVQPLVENDLGQSIPLNLDARIHKAIEILSHANLDPALLVNSSHCFGIEPFTVEKTNSLQCIPYPNTQSQPTGCKDYTNSILCTENNPSLVDYHASKMDITQYKKLDMMISFPSDNSSSSYQLTSPTTMRNLFRLLRALELNKPVLLEGSPGVGKTSIVEALGMACGKRIVRINLSEQTDILDLLGSDLPVDTSEKISNNDKRTESSLNMQETSTILPFGGVVDHICTANEIDNQGNATQKTSSTSSSLFEWCDGIFLSALKAGHWILLDELNLANQSVLEGLNSVLDYRREVFIPELNKTFQCPTGFRIFAAQNPTSQGGGRKGLPKSFLNRFTKVYLDPMNSEDMCFIANNMYPLVDSSVIKYMVEYNQALMEATMNDYQFGKQGRPWEFNLRDVLRWAKLVSQYPSAQPHDFVDLLYFKRLRTLQDRQYAADLYQKIFNKSLLLNSKPYYKITPIHLQVGQAWISRVFRPTSQCFEGSLTATGTTIDHGNQSRHVSSYFKAPSFTNQTPILLRHLMPTLESLIYCIQNKWLVNLVGPMSSGKTSVLKLAASITGNVLHTFSVNPSIDTLEILGGFEQIDIQRHSRSILDNLRNTTNYIIRLLFTHSISLSHTQTNQSQSFFSHSESNKALGLEAIELLISKWHVLETTKVEFQSLIYEPSSLKMDSVQLSFDNNITSNAMDNQQTQQRKDKKHFFTDSNLIKLTFEILSLLDQILKLVNQTRTKCPAHSNGKSSPIPVSTKDNGAQYNPLYDIESELHHAGLHSPTRLRKDFYKILELLSSNDLSGHFEWVDGILVEALQHGHWIVMENVNLCSSSVLDRLLPLFEPNGVLQIPEKGLVGGKVPIIKPHPNFVIFFTMDPKYGEISRAMRNRTIEIATTQIPVDYSFDTHMLMSQAMQIHDATLFDKMIQFHRVMSGIEKIDPKLAKLLSSSTIQIENSNYMNHSDLIVNESSLARIFNQDLNIRDLIHWASLSLDQVQRGLGLKSSLRSSMEQVYVNCQLNPLSRNIVSRLFDVHFAYQELTFDGKQLLYESVCSPGFTNQAYSLENQRSASIELNIHYQSYMKALVDPKFFLTIQNPVNLPSQIATHDESYDFDLNVKKYMLTSLSNNDQIGKMRTDDIDCSLSDYHLNLNINLLQNPKYFIVLHTILLIFKYASRSESHQWLDWLKINASSIRDKVLNTNSVDQMKINNAEVNSNDHLQMLESGKLETMLDWAFDYLITKSEFFNSLITIVQELITQVLKPHLDQILHPSPYLAVHHSGPFTASSEFLLVNITKSLPCQLNLNQPLWNLIGNLARNNLDHWKLFNQAADCLMKQSLYFSTTGYAWIDNNSYPINEPDKCIQNMNYYGNQPSNEVNINISHPIIFKPSSKFLDSSLISYALFFFKELHSCIISWIKQSQFVISAEVSDYNGLFRDPLYLKLDTIIRLRFEIYTWVLQYQLQHFNIVQFVPAWRWLIKSINQLINMSKLLATETPTTQLFPTPKHIIKLSSTLCILMDRIDEIIAKEHGTKFKFSLWKHQGHHMLFKTLTFFKLYENLSHLYLQNIHGSNDREISKSIRNGLATILYLNTFPLSTLKELDAPNDQNKYYNLSHNRGNVQSKSFSNDQLSNLYFSLQHLAESISHKLLSHHNFSQTSNTKYQSASTGFSPDQPKSKNISILSPIFDFQLLHLQMKLIKSLQVLLLHTKIMSMNVTSTNLEERPDITQQQQPFNPFGSDFQFKPNFHDLTPEYYDSLRSIKNNVSLILNLTISCKWVHSGFMAHLQLLTWIIDTQLNNDFISHSNSLKADRLNLGLVKNILSYLKYYFLESSTSRQLKDFDHRFQSNDKATADSLQKQSNGTYSSMSQLSNNTHLSTTSLANIDDTSHKTALFSAHSQNQCQGIQNINSLDITSRSLRIDEFNWIRLEQGWKSYYILTLVNRLNGNVPLIDRERIIDESFYLLRYLSTEQFDDDPLSTSTANNNKSHIQPTVKEMCLKLDYANQSNFSLNDWIQLIDQTIDTLQCLVHTFDLPSNEEVNTQSSYSTILFSIRKALHSGLTGMDLHQLFDQALQDHNITKAILLKCIGFSSDARIITQVTKFPVIPYIIQILLDLIIPMRNIWDHYYNQHFYKASFEVEKIAHKADHPIDVDYVFATNSNLLPLLSDPVVMSLKSQLLIWTSYLRLTLLIPSERIDSVMKYESRIDLLASAIQQLILQRRILHHAETQFTDSPNFLTTIETTYIQSQFDSLLVGVLNKQTDRSPLAPSYSVLYQKMVDIYSTYCKFEKINNLAQSYLSLVVSTHVSGKQPNIRAKYPDEYPQVDSAISTSSFSLSDSNMLLQSLTDQESQFQTNITQAISTLRSIYLTHYPDVIGPIINCLYDIKRGLKMMKHSSQLMLPVQQFMGKSQEFALEMHEDPMGVLEIIDTNNSRNFHMVNNQTEQNISSETILARGRSSPTCSNNTGLIDLFKNHSSLTLHCLTSHIQTVIFYLLQNCTTSLNCSLTYQLLEHQNQHDPIQFILSRYTLQAIHLMTEFNKNNNCKGSISQSAGFNSTSTSNNPLHDSNIKSWITSSKHTKKLLDIRASLLKSCLNMVYQQVEQKNVLTKPIVNTLDYIFSVFVDSFKASEIQKQKKVQAENEFYKYKTKEYKVVHEHDQKEEDFSQVFPEYYSQFDRVIETVQQEFEYSSFHQYSNSLNTVDNNGNKPYVGDYSKHASQTTSQNFNQESNIHLQLKSSSSELESCIFHISDRDVYQLFRIHYKIFTSHRPYLQPKETIDFLDLKHSNSINSSKTSVGNSLIDMSKKGDYKNRETSLSRLETYKIALKLARLLRYYIPCDTQQSRLDHAHMIIINHSLDEIEAHWKNDALTTTHRKSSSLATKKTIYPDNDKDENQILTRAKRIEAIVKSSSISTSHSDLYQLIPNFYTSSNPGETSLLLEPLSNFLEYIEHLISLDEIGRNQVLLTLAGLIKSLLNTPINHPLMHFITGVEILIEKSDDWERYQPSQYSIKTHMDLLLKITSRWRSMELEYWPLILLSKEQQFRLQASRWWFHLYSVLHDREYRISQHKQSSEQRDGDDKKHSSHSGSHGTKADQILLCLQTFVENSNYGEFSTRLHIILGFYYQLSAQYEFDIQTTKNREQDLKQDIQNDMGIFGESLCRISSSLDERKNTISNLYHVYRYYIQFLPLIQEHIAQSKAKLEKKLIDYIKLSRWDDDTFYRLRQASQAARRHLSAISSEYEKQVLSIPISTFFCKLATNSFKLTLPRELDYHAKRPSVSYHSSPLDLSTKSNASVLLKKITSIITKPLQLITCHQCDVFPKQLHLKIDQLFLKVDKLWRDHIFLKMSNHSTRSEMQLEYFISDIIEIRARLRDRQSKHDTSHVKGRLFKTLLNRLYDIGLDYHRSAINKNISTTHDILHKDVQTDSQVKDTDLNSIQNLNYLFIQPIFEDSISKIPIYWDHLQEGQQIAPKDNTLSTGMNSQELHDHLSIINEAISDIHITDENSQLCVENAQAAISLSPNSNCGSARNLLNDIICEFKNTDHHYYRAVSMLVLLKDVYKRSTVHLSPAIANKTIGSGEHLFSFLLLQRALIKNSLDRTQHADKLIKNFSSLIKSMKQQETTTQDHSNTSLDGVTQFGNSIYYTPTIHQIEHQEHQFASTYSLCIDILPPQGPLKEAFLHQKQDLDILISLLITQCEIIRVFKSTQSMHAKQVMATSDPNNHLSVLHKYLDPQVLESSIQFFEQSIYSLKKSKTDIENGIAIKTYGPFDSLSESNSMSDSPTLIFDQNNLLQLAYSDSTIANILIQCESYQFLPIGFRMNLIVDFKKRRNDRIKYRERNGLYSWLRRIQGALHPVYCHSITSIEENNNIQKHESISYSPLFDQSTADICLDQSLCDVSSSLLDSLNGSIKALLFSIQQVFNLETKRIEQDSKTTDQKMSQWMSSELKITATNEKNDQSPEIHQYGNTHNNQEVDDSASLHQDSNTNSVLSPPDEMQLLPFNLLFYMEHLKGLLDVLDSPKIFQNIYCLISTLSKLIDHHFKESNNTSSSLTESIPSPSSNSVHQVVLCLEILLGQYSLLLEKWHLIHLTVLSTLIKISRKSCIMCCQVFATFREVFLDGFLDVETEDQNNDEQDQNLSDIEGMGLTDGKGKNDVTDQYSDEEQLLGNKPLEKEEDKEKDPEEPDEQPVDPDTGVEMENDFDGEMHSLQQKENDNSDSQSSDSESGDPMDREMDEIDPDLEEILDEKLWNDEDDLQESEQSRYEKNAPIDNNDENGQSELEARLDDEDYKSPPQDPNEKNRNPNNNESQKKKQMDTQDNPDPDLSNEEEMEQNAPSDQEDDKSAEDMSELEYDDQTADSYKDSHHMNPHPEPEEFELGSETNSGDDSPNDDESGQVPNDPMQGLDLGSNNDESSDDQIDAEDGEGARHDEFPEVNDQDSNPLQEDAKCDSQDDMDESKADNQSLPGNTDEPVESTDEEQQDEPEQDESDDDAIRHDPFHHPNERDNNRYMDAFGVQDVCGLEQQSNIRQGDQSQQQAPAEPEESNPLHPTNNHQSRLDQDPNGQKQTRHNDPLDHLSTEQVLGDDNRKQKQPNDTKDQEKSLNTSNTNQSLDSHSDRIEHDPNPLRSLGDALQHWNHHLSLVPDQVPSNSQVEDPKEEQGEAGNEGQDTSADPNQLFEFAHDKETHDDQVLGTATDEQLEESTAILDQTELDIEESTTINPPADHPQPIMIDPDQSLNENPDQSSECSKRSNPTHQSKAANKGDQGNNIDELDAGQDENEGGSDTDSSIQEIQQATDALRVSTDPKNSNGESNDIDDIDMDNNDDNFDLSLENIDNRLDTLAEMRDALQSMIHDIRLHPESTALGSEIWRMLQMITAPATCQLCEQLKLILEPTLKSKMQGDYRTGKRLNMRRIVTYVASQFRKDKIWLRRTQPNKRDYQVLLALDDSKSVEIGKSAQLVREAMATLTLALQRLEVGQISLVKFGENVSLLHPFEGTFTDSTASLIMSQLTFEQTRTNMEKLLEKTMQMFEIAKYQNYSPSNQQYEIKQLMFIIGDGRFGDLKASVKRWLDLAQSKNIFIVFLVLDCLDKDQSILNIQTVQTGPKGKMVIRSYIDLFPFTYYIVLRELSNLPYILADALRQWFELINRNDAHTRI